MILLSSRVDCGVALIVAKAAWRITENPIKTHANKDHHNEFKHIAQILYKLTRALACLLIDIKDFVQSGV